MTRAHRAENQVGGMWARSAPGAQRRGCAGVDLARQEAVDQPRHPKGGGANGRRHSRSPSGGHTKAAIPRDRLGGHVDVGRRVAALAAAMAIGAGLRLTGGGGLAVPLHSAEQFGRWIHDTPAPVMAVALVRVAAVAACGYLAFALVLLLLADLVGWRGLARLALRALPTILRQSLARGAQMSLAAGAVLGAVNPVAAGPAAPLARGDDPVVSTAVMWRLGPEARAEDTPSIATMVLLADTPPSEAQPPAERPESALPQSPDPTRPEPPAALDAPTAPAPDPVVLQPSMDPAAATSAVETWVVGAGDSFWSIAEAVMAEHRRTLQQTEPDVGRYWSRLIAANRDRLAAPDHPDLLIPGQALVLPRPS